MHDVSIRGGFQRPRSRSSGHLGVQEADVGHMLLVFRLDSIEHQCLDRHCLDSEGKRRL